MKHLFTKFLGIFLCLVLVLFFSGCGVANYAKTYGSEEDVKIAKPATTDAAQNELACAEGAKWTSLKVVHDITTADGKISTEIRIDKKEAPTKIYSETTVFSGKDVKATAKSYLQENDIYMTFAEKDAEPLKIKIASDNASRPLFEGIIGVDTLNQTLNAVGSAIMLGDTENLECGYDAKGNFVVQEKGKDGKIAMRAVLREKMVRTVSIGGGFGMNPGGQAVTKKKQCLLMYFTTSEGLAPGDYTFTYGSASVKYPDFKDYQEPTLADILKITAILLGQ